MGMVEQFIRLLGPWNWWVLGLVLAAVEIFAPGSLFIWFAVAAILVGTVALFLDMSWQAELVLFVGLAVAAAVVGRRLVRVERPEAKTEAHINDRLARQVGRLATLDTPITNGAGHIRLDDTIWRVEGPDLPAGAQVRICGHTEGRLRVEAA